MISTLENLDKRTALGILARAALALESGNGNPAASAAIRDELAIREALFREARSRLGVAPDDNSPEAVEKLGDFLDAESDKLVEPLDTNAALERLAERGDLPSDLYQIVIIPNISEIHGKNMDLEARLIDATIRTPDREHHYGPPTIAGIPYMISLFAKQFRTPWPYKNFTMLVAADRQKLQLNVHQAWRLYPAFVDDRGSDLVELLRRFAAVYGIELDIGNQKGHFFVWSDHVLPQTIKVVTKGKPQRFTITQFTQNLLSREPQAALIVAIDLNKYRALLTQMWVPAEDILSLDSPKHIPAKFAR
jgi:hypothetical protein